MSKITSYIKGSQAISKIHNHKLYIKGSQAISKIHKLYQRFTSYIKDSQAISKIHKLYIKDSQAKIHNLYQRFTSYMYIKDLQAKAYVPLHHRMDTRE